MRHDSWWSGLLAGLACALLGAIGWQFLNSEAPQVSEVDQAGQIEALQTEIDRLRLLVERDRVSTPALRVSAPTPPDPSADLSDEVRRALGKDMSGERVNAAIRRAQQLRSQAESASLHAAQRAAHEAKVAVEKERRFLEDKARGGTMQMLRALESAGTPVFDLVSSPEDFEKHFVRHVDGPSPNERTWEPDAPLENGTHVLLAPGTHRWDVAGYLHRNAFPSDVLIEGAGMDKTLLILNELESRQEIKSLTFKDLTIDCSNNYFTDLRRNEPVTISMENVRVVGFDMGAGGSVMLAARTAAFYAKGCRFEAGYARTDAGSGNVFRVGSGLLARLENCAFIGPFRSVFDANRSATYVFSDCTFEEMLPRLAATFKAPPRGVRLENSTWNFQSPDAIGRIRPVRRRLRDLNSNW